MFDKGLDTTIAVISGVLMVAVVAVLVGKNAKTSDVISSAGSALTGVIGAAVQPVS